MDPRIRTVQTMLQRDLRVTPRAATLAASVGLSLSRLEHLFRDETNMTIRQYVKYRRLRLAARMLRGSHERVSTIAFSVGFNDASNFNHAFKALFGQSPLQYRRGAEKNEYGSAAINTK